MDITHILGQLSRWELWLFASAAVLAAPVCEEFLFRGVVQQGLAAGTGRPAEAICPTGLVFALFHLNPVSFPALLELRTFLRAPVPPDGFPPPGNGGPRHPNATTLGIYSFRGDRNEAPETAGDSP